MKDNREEIKDFENFLIVDLKIQNQNS